MKNTVSIIGTILIPLITTSSFSYADANEDFVTVENAVNLTFVESIAKNRAHKGEEKSAKYMHIDGNEEFMEAIKNDQFSDIGDVSKIQKQYVSRTIENVDLDERDLDGIDSDTLNLGSKTDGGNIVQSLNIINSKIKTDKYINAGIDSSSTDISDLTSVTNIEDSELSAGNPDKDEGISTSKYFD